MIGVWQSIQRPPVEDGLYLVFAPTEDNQRNPFVRTAWWRQSGWLDLPYGWGTHVTHWARILRVPQ